jgi:hypothetical protein
MNTGTPMALNPSARRWSVTVLPVPVAPAMSPWRLAIFGSRCSFCFALAIRIGSDIENQFTGLTGFFRIHRIKTQSFFGFNLVNPA